MSNESDIYVKILQCHLKQTIYRAEESTENQNINGINTFYFLSLHNVHVWWHFILRTKKFFQFWIVLRGKTSPQDNAGEQNEILLILYPRQCSKRTKQDKIKVA